MVYFTVIVNRNGWKEERGTCTLPYFFLEKSCAQGKHTKIQHKQNLSKRIYNLGLNILELYNILACV